MHRPQGFDEVRLYQQLCARNKDGYQDKAAPFKTRTHTPCLEEVLAPFYPDLAAEGITVAEGRTQIDTFKDCTR